MKRELHNTSNKALSSLVKGFNSVQSNQFKQTIKPPEIVDFKRLLVGVTGFEPAASCSQSKRATNCATPRYYLVFNSLYPSVYIYQSAALPSETLSHCSLGALRIALCFFTCVERLLLPQAAAFSSPNCATHRCCARSNLAVKFLLRKSEIALRQ